MPTFIPQIISQHYSCVYFRFLKCMRDLIPLHPKGEEVHSPRAWGNSFAAGVHSGGILRRLDWRWGCGS